MSGFFHLLDWVYPTTCVLCGMRSERSLCPECLGKLPPLPRPLCLYCGRPVEGGQADPYRCPACADKPRHFSFARHLFLQDDVTMNLVYALKYHRANHLAAAFVPAMLSLWAETPEFRQGGDWALAPVPMTRARLRARGYNQSEELSLALGKALGLPVINALERKDTGIASQTTLSAAQREQNAFAAIRPAQACLAGKRKVPPRLAVIDDVFTTGSTAQACARSLRLLPGVKDVAVLTLVLVGMEWKTYMGTERNEPHADERATPAYGDAANGGKKERKKRDFD